MDQNLNTTTTTTTTTTTKTTITTKEEFVHSQLKNFLSALKGILLTDTSSYIQNNNEKTKRKKKTKDNIDDIEHQSISSFTNEELNIISTLKDSIEKKSGPLVCLKKILSDPSIPSGIINTNHLNKNYNQIITNNNENLQNFNNFENNENNENFENFDNSKYPPPLPEIKNKSILKQVFTHKSFTHYSLYGPGSTKVNKNSNNDKDNSLDLIQNYERMEFLGDSYLNHIVTTLIFNRFADLKEGDLTSIRSKVVSNITVSEWGKLYNFDTNLVVSDSAIRQKINLTGKIVADVFEAYIAGVVLDRPSPQDAFIELQSWIANLAEPILSTIQEQLSISEPLNRDAKIYVYKQVGSAFQKPLYLTLQEVENQPNIKWGTSKAKSNFLKPSLQANSLINSSTNSSNCNSDAPFCCCLVLSDTVVSYGWGKNKKDAGLRAAMSLLKDESLLSKYRQIRDDLNKEYNKTHESDLKEMEKLNLNEKDLQLMRMDPNMSARSELFEKICSKDSIIEFLLTEDNILAPLKFTKVVCRLNGNDIGYGYGRTRKDATSRAAMQILLNEPLLSSLISYKEQIEKHLLNKRNSLENETTDFTTSILYNEQNNQTQSTPDSLLNNSPTTSIDNSRLTDSVLSTSIANSSHKQYTDAGKGMFPEDFYKVKKKTLRKRSANEVSDNYDTENKRSKANPQYFYNEETVTTNFTNNSNNIASSVVPQVNTTEFLNNSIITSTIPSQGTNINFTNNDSNISTPSIPSQKTVIDFSNNNNNNNNDIITQSASSQGTGTDSSHNNSGIITPVVASQETGTIFPNNNSNITIPSFDSQGANTNFSNNTPSFASQVVTTDLPKINTNSITPSTDSQGKTAGFSNNNYNSFVISSTDSQGTNTGYSNSNSNNFVTPSASSEGLITDFSDNINNAAPSVIPQNKEVMMNSSTSPVSTINSNTHQHAERVLHKDTDDAPIFIRPDIERYLISTKIQHNNKEEYPLNNLPSNDQSGDSTFNTQTNNVSSNINTNDVSSNINTNDVSSNIQTNGILSNVQKDGIFSNITNDNLSNIHGNDYSQNILINDLSLNIETPESFSKNAAIKSRKKLSSATSQSKESELQSRSSKKSTQKSLSKTSPTKAAKKSTREPKGKGKESTLSESKNFTSSTVDRVPIEPSKDRESLRNSIKDSAETTGITKNTTSNTSSSTTKNSTASSSFSLAARNNSTSTMPGSSRPKVSLETALKAKQKPKTKTKSKLDQRKAALEKNLKTTKDDFLSDAVTSHYNQFSSVSSTEPEGPNLYNIIMQMSQDNSKNTSLESQNATPSVLSSDNTDKNILPQNSSSKNIVSENINSQSKESVKNTLQNNFSENIEDIPQKSVPYYIELQNDTTKDNTARLNDSYLEKRSKKSKKARSVSSTVESSFNSIDSSEIPSPAYEDIASPAYEEIEVPVLSNTIKKNSIDKSSSTFITKENNEVSTSSSTTTNDSSKYDETSSLNNFLRTIVENSRPIENSTPKSNSSTLKTKSRSKKNDNELSSNKRESTVKSQKAANIRNNNNELNSTTPDNLHDRSIIQDAKNSSYGSNSKETTKHNTNSENLNKLNLKEVKKIDKKRVEYNLNENEKIDNNVQNLSELANQESAPIFDLRTVLKEPELPEPNSESELLNLIDAYFQKVKIRVYDGPEKLVTAIESDRLAYSAFSVLRENCDWAKYCAVVSIESDFLGAGYGRTVLEARTRAAHVALQNEAKISIYKARKEAAWDNIASDSWSNLLSDD